ncbi:hypothetical protein CspeluHIS016_0115200 [Cutaneotrichosporon spelunceum]|uniref:alpha-galactosidase n=1 Tax=Cutaneotrichosporon spelunceum TaxID=1672016 RepID=A0AAD3TQR8_9TREE|nr:hypothetical protein CspeluHIS016_0115200 [Cutaneotrichosporon spelunceum]
MGTALIQFIPSDGPDSNSYQKDGTRSKSDLESASSINKRTHRQRWPLWKKMVILGFLLVLIIPLAVGVPVGLCIKRGDSESASTAASASASASSSASATASHPTAVWQPAVGTTWQIVLSEQVTITNGKPTPDVDVYDIDLFDVESSTIAALHAAGKKVICYFSAGSYEDWRPDAKDWDQSDFGSDLQGWKGEKWVKTGSAKVRSIMAQRIQMAADKGCDAVDPDNVDGYNNANGLGLTEADAADYVKFLARESAKYNMGCGLKNAAAIVPQVSTDVQFSVVEQCAEYDECAKYRGIIDQHKPVFSIEYPSGAGTKMASDSLSAVCNASGSANFSMIMKKMNLDQWVEFCDGQVS